MKKYFSILAAAVLLLTGCTDEKTSPDSSEPSGSSDIIESAPENLPVGGITYKGASSGETFLKGLDGKSIEVSEITSLADKNYKPTAVLDENDFGSCECQGFAYAYKPSILFESSRDPNVFDDEVYVGENVKRSSEYIRVNVGETYNGLTVKQARTVFNKNDDDYYEGSEIEFDGEITLTGWISIIDVDPKYPNVILDMEFQCDTEKQIPLACDFYFDPEYGFCHAPQGGWGVYTDIPKIYLGKYPDYNIDFHDLKEGDIWVRAEITVEKVKMVCGIQGDGGHIRATLCDVKPL